MRRILVFFRNFLISLFLDPVAFVSLVAPFLISIAMGLINGQFLAQKGQSNTSTLDILANPSLPGVVDYIIQYYTALVAFVIGFGKYVFHDIFLPRIQKGNDAIRLNKDASESIWMIAFQIYSVMVLLFALSAFFVLAPKLSLLEIYTNHTTKFGIRLPPLESPLTWLRWSIGAYGLIRFHLFAKQPKRTSIEAAPQSSAVAVK